MFVERYINKNDMMDNRKFDVLSSGPYSWLGYIMKA